MNYKCEFNLEGMVSVDVVAGNRTYNLDANHWRVEDGETQRYLESQGSGWVVMSQVDSDALYAKDCDLVRI